MTVKHSYKSTLFTRILPELKKQTPFFSTNAVRLALTKEKIKLVDETLREYMSEAMAKGIVNDAGRGWYSRHDKLCTVDPKPIQKIIRIVEKIFPLLDFCCWSTLQLNPFALHLIGTPTILLYAEIDALAPVAEKLKQAGWDAWANPKKDDVQRFVNPGEKTVILRPIINKQPKCFKHCAPIEKILVDLVAESNSLYLMDESEIQIIVDAVFQSGLVQIPVFTSYTERRKLKISSKEIAS